MSEGPQTRKLRRPLRCRTNLRFAGAAALAALLGVGGVLPRAHAADGTWNGLADDSQWTNTGNWLDGIIAGNNSGASGTSIDTATFVTNPPPPVTDPPMEWAVVNVDPNRNIKNLTFASSTITFRIGTNTFND